MAVRTVIFDIGNVLLDVNRKFLLGKVFTCPDRMSDFFDHVCTRNSWQVPINQGVPPDDLVVSLSQKFPEYAGDIQTFNDQWGTLISGAIDQSVQILNDLSKTDVDLYALTDWPKDKFDIVERRFPEILSHFKDVAISSVERVTKPHPEIYQILIGRNGLNPLECLFIDDRIENVETAQSLGMQGHHFTTPENLRADLIKRMLL